MAFVPFITFYPLWGYLKLAFFGHKTKTSESGDKHFKDMHFKLNVSKPFLKSDHFSAVAEIKTIGHNIKQNIKTIGHNIKWDHFDILAFGKTDYHCKIKETLIIQELQPALNVNVFSEKLLLY